MSRPDEIAAQYRAGLISKSEARADLSRLAKQSQFNADYADDPKAYFQYTRDAESARAALTSIGA